MNNYEFNLWHHVGMVAKGLRVAAETAAHEGDDITFSVATGRGVKTTVITYELTKTVFFIILIDHSHTYVIFALPMKAFFTLSYLSFAYLCNIYPDNESLLHFFCKIIGIYFRTARLCGI